MSKVRYANFAIWLGDGGSKPISGDLPAYTKEKGWGPRPGILVFGPGGRGRGVSVPAVSTLARERQYIDNLPSIQWNEFTVYQSLCFPAAVYPVLAQGGTWNTTKDPFAGLQK